MKDAIKFIDFILWAMLGLLLGACAYQVIDYLCFPDKYVIMSAPWYTILIFYAVVAAAAALILLLVRCILRSILKKKDKAE
ncbi:MAG: hypothetical protein IJI19_07405 [Ruminococcus sp.]|nr:hypothetical protein [Ruminococcus sp.]